MKNQTSSKPCSLYFLMGCILFQGNSGLFDSITLVIDPTGELLRMPRSMLETSQFNNFLVTGLIPQTILSIFPMVLFYGIQKRMNWAWMGAFMVSVALNIWIGVEIWIVGYHPEPPLQFIYGLMGLILLTLTFFHRSEIHFMINQIGFNHA